MKTDDELKEMSLIQLSDAIAEHKAAVDSHKKQVSLYEGEILNRVGKPNQPGTMTFVGDNGACVVRISTPKKVIYDQSALAGIGAEIENEWAEKLTDYMSVTYSIPETAFKGWPPALQKKFEHARTVGLGKPKVEIIALESEVA